MTLSRARCTNHEGRQASGMCPSCRRPYCRECLTEHDGRLSCASCLRRSAPAVKAGGSWRKQATGPLMLAAAILLSWFVFYALGSTLEQSTAPSPERTASGDKL